MITLVGRIEGIQLQFTSFRANFSAIFLSIINLTYSFVMFHIAHLWSSRFLFFLSNQMCLGSIVPLVFFF